MPKPYSQDLRNRVIDAVERGEMTPRARRGATRSANRWRSSGSNALNAMASEKPVGHGGHRTSKLMAHRDFLEAVRAEKSDVTLQALSAIAKTARRQIRYLDDEPLLSPSRRHV